MKTIVGKFTRPDGKPAANAILTLTLSQDARVIATGEKLVGSRGSNSRSGDLHEIVIELDENGAIPPGKEIHASDELKPAGTYYSVSVVSASNGYDESCYGEWLKIVGESPIDLLALTPEKETPEYVSETLETEPVRALPPHKPGFNYLGFVGGVIHPPSSTGVCKMPALIDRYNYATPKGVGGTFAAFGFHLPFKSIVSRVSIIAEAAYLGHHVLVGLYDGEGNKRCAARIDVSKGGIATGEFESAVPLSAGIYYMAWTAPGGGIEARSIGANLGQFDLANAGGGAVVLGTCTVPEGATTLPDTLGRLTPCHSYAPILAYFKA